MFDCRIFVKILVFFWEYWLGITLKSNYYIFKIEFGFIFLLNGFNHQLYIWLAYCRENINLGINYITQTFVSKIKLINVVYIISLINPQERSQALKSRQPSDLYLPAPVTFFLAGVGTVHHLSPSASLSSSSFLLLWCPLLHPLFIVWRCHPLFRSSWSQGLGSSQPEQYLFLGVPGNPGQVAPRLIPIPSLSTRVLCSSVVAASAHPHP